MAVRFQGGKAVPQEPKNGRFKDDFSRIEVACAKANRELMAVREAMMGVPVDSKTYRWLQRLDVESVRNQLANVARVAGVEKTQ